MARKSQWQQFADNFNSVYGSFTKMAQDWETQDVMEEQPELITTDTGTQQWQYGGKTYDKEITPEMLRGLQYQRLGDVMTKYGDAKGAMEMGLRSEELQEKRRENEIKQSAYLIDKPFNDAMVQYSQQAKDFKSAEEAKDAFFNIYEQFKPQEAQAMRNKWSADDVQKVTLDGQKVSKEIQNIMSDPKQGLQGVVKWIDDNNGINAGAKLITNQDGSMSLVATSPETGEPIETIASGANEVELRAQLEAFTTPGGSTKLAAQMLEQRKAEAQIAKDRAAAEKYKSETGKGGRDFPNEQKNKAWADYRRSEAYIMEADGKGLAEKEAMRRRWSDEYDRIAGGNRGGGLTSGASVPTGVTITKEK